MNHFRLLDLPQFVPPEAYRQSLDFMTDQLSKINGLVALYQVGGITTPGISDIDMIAVFKNDFSFTKNPLRRLSPRHKYLFIHGLYGASEFHFKKALNVTFFHHYNLLAGKAVEPEPSAYSAMDIVQLKNQIALEYLVKMYINLAVQKTYRFIKVRNLMLHVKGLLYDIEFLNISDKKIISLTDEMMHFRKTWFQKKPPDPEIFNWLENSLVVLENLLESALHKHEMFGTWNSELPIAKNIFLLNSTHVGYTYRGLVIPYLSNLLTNFGIRLQNRFVNFIFTIPASSGNPYPAILEQHKIIQDMKNYNREFLPNFYPLATSLNT